MFIKYKKIDRIFFNKERKNKKSKNKLKQRLKPLNANKKAKKFRRRSVT